jgi:acyl carrier protein
LQWLASRNGAANSRTAISAILIDGRGGIFRGRAVLKQEKLNTRSGRREAHVGLFMSENEMKLVGCFVEVLGLNEADVKDDLKYQSVLAWDSVAHMSLVVALENAFDVMLDTDEIIALESVAKARAILKKHGAEF